MDTDRITLATARLLRLLDLRAVEREIRRREIETLRERVERIEAMASGRGGA